MATMRCSFRDLFAESAPIVNNEHHRAASSRQPTRPPEPGWHATRLPDLCPGDSVVIYGSGPVGLMATHSAVIQGASHVFVVDHNTDRLQIPEKLGAIPIVEDEGRGGRSDS